MKTEYAPLDVSSYLTDEETIAEYLTAAAEDENPDVLLRALAEVAKARGMAQVARDAGLGRESLYKALAPGSHPRFETINAVFRAVGVRVAAKTPVKKAAAAAKAMPVKKAMPAVKKTTMVKKTGAKAMNVAPATKAKKLAAKRASRRSSPSRSLRVA